MLINLMQSICCAFFPHKCLSYKIASKNNLEEFLYAFNVDQKVTTYQEAHEAKGKSGFHVMLYLFDDSDQNENAPGSSDRSFCPKRLFGIKIDGLRGLLFLCNKVWHKIEIFHISA